MGKAELHRVRLRADAVRLPAALLLAGGVPAAVEVDANVGDLGHSHLDARVRGAPRHLLEVLRRREGLHRNAHRDALAATRAHRPEIHRTEPPPTALQQAFQVRPGDPRHQHRLSGRAEARQIWARLGASDASLQQAHQRILTQAGRVITRWTLSNASSPCWGAIRRATASPQRWCWGSWAPARPRSFRRSRRWRATSLLRSPSRPSRRSGSWARAVRCPSSWLRWRARTWRS